MKCQYAGSVRFHMPTQISASLMQFIKVEL